MAERTLHQRWVEVREPATGKLLFLFDPERRLLSIKPNGFKDAVLVDLQDYETGVHGKSL